MSTPSFASVSHAQTALPAAQAASQAASQAATQPAIQTPLPLAPLHLPAEPGLWPVAWGWWAILALVILSIFLLRYLSISAIRNALLRKKPFYDC